MHSVTLMTQSLKCHSAVLDMYYKMFVVRLVYDRETGKPKGYGFCEYQDQETALSAMRNLNGREFSGRALRVDNAASEKNKEELKSMCAYTLIYFLWFKLWTPVLLFAWFQCSLSHCSTAFTNNTVFLFTSRHYLCWNIAIHVLKHV